MVPEPKNSENFYSRFLNNQKIKSKVEDENENTLLRPMIKNQKRKRSDEKKKSILFIIFI